MVDQWEPGTQYDYGAVVSYEGLPDLFFHKCNPNRLSR